MPIRQLISTSQSKLDYYASMNKTFRQIFGKSLMLHYPFYKRANETLEQRQINLTDHCIEKVGSMDGKTILEVGCGNGLQSIYMASTFQPAKVTGIDLIPENIAIACEQSIDGLPVEFHVDDAQKLQTVSADSVDILVCIESALHYPQKELFFQQVKRVLRPGGKFVIADIVNKSAGRTYPSARWKRKMSYFHWTVDQYKSNFDGAGLRLLYEENLTDRVIRGYNGYENWVNWDNTRSFYRYILFKIFAMIHVGINVQNLKKKENYYLFVGSRE